MFWKVHRGFHDLMCHYVALGYNHHYHGLHMSICFLINITNLVKIYHTGYDINFYIKYFIIRGNYILEKTAIKVFHSQ